MYTYITEISNKNGADKARRNKYYKNKKITKISVITDDKRIQIIANIYSDNIYDSKIRNIKIISLLRTLSIKHENV